MPPRVCRAFIVTLVCVFLSNIFDATTADVPSSIKGVVPEAVKYEIIYELDIPAVNTILGSINNLNYGVDRSESGISFDRVAYVLQLDDEWVWVSFDTFTTSLSKLGVPVLSALPHGAKQYVNNLNIFSNKPTTDLKQGIYAKGNIEFWGGDYISANGEGIPSADTTSTDFDDTFAVGGYGCMQVHNYLESETVLAYNNWGTSQSGAVSDLGIGNRATGQPDWTSAANAQSYTATRKLYVLVSTTTRSYLSSFGRHCLQGAAIIGWLDGKSSDYASSGRSAAECRRLCDNYPTECAGFDFFRPSGSCLFKGGVFPDTFEAESIGNYKKGTCTNARDFHHSLLPSGQEGSCKTVGKRVETISFAKNFPISNCLPVGGAFVHFAGHVCGSDGSIQWESSSVVQNRPLGRSFEDCSFYHSGTVLSQMWLGGCGSIPKRFMTSGAAHGPFFGFVNHYLKTGQDQCNVPLTVPQCETHARLSRQSFSMIHDSNYPYGCTQTNEAKLVQFNTDHTLKNCNPINNVKCVCSAGIVNRACSQNCLRNQVEQVTSKSDCGGNTADVRIGGSVAHKGSEALMKTACGKYCFDNRESWVGHAFAWSEISAHIISSTSSVYPENCAALCSLNSHCTAWETVYGGSGVESDGCHLIKLGGIAAPAPLSLEDADYFDYSAGLVNRLPECEYFRVSSKAIDNSIEDECFQEHLQDNCLRNNLNPEPSSFRTYRLSDWETCSSVALSPRPAESPWESHVVANFGERKVSSSAEWAPLTVTEKSLFCQSLKGHRASKGTFIDNKTIHFDFLGPSLLRCDITLPRSYIGIRGSAIITADASSSVDDTASGAMKTNWDQQSFSFGQTEGLACVSGDKSVQTLSMCKIAATTLGKSWLGAISDVTKGPGCINIHSPSWYVPTDVSTARPTRSSGYSNNYGPERAVDGNLNQDWSTDPYMFSSDQDAERENIWWGVSLAHEVTNPRVTIVAQNSETSKFGKQLELWIGNDWPADSQNWDPGIAAKKCGWNTNVDDGSTTSTDCLGTGSYVFIRISKHASCSESGGCILRFSEIVVIGQKAFPSSLHGDYVAYNELGSDGPSQRGISVCESETVHSSGSLFFGSHNAVIPRSPSLGAITTTGTIRFQFTSNLPSPSTTIRLESIQNNASADFRLTINMEVLLLGPSSASTETPAPRHSHSLFIDNDYKIDEVHTPKPYVYMLGGKQGEKVYSDLFEFDVRNNSWRKPFVVDNGQHPGPMYGHRVISYKDSMLVFGGCCFRNLPHNFLYSLDLESMTWTKLMSLNSPPQGRMYHSFVRWENYAYVYGGRVAGVPRIIEANPCGRAGKKNAITSAALIPQSPSLSLPFDVYAKFGSFSQLTYEVWMKTPDVFHSSSKMEIISGHSVDHGWFLERHPQCHGGFCMHLGGSGIYGKTPLHSGRWYHLAVTMTKDFELIYFVNGQVDVRARIANAKTCARKPFIAESPGNPCPASYTEVTDNAFGECEAAASSTAINKPWISTFTSYENHLSGCIITSSQEVRVNSGGSATSGEGQKICKPKPYLTVAEGKQCPAQYKQVDNFAECLITKSEGSLSFSSRTSGSCTDILNTFSITTSTMCDEASSALGWSDTTSSTEVGSDARPVGCFKDTASSDQLFLQAGLSGDYTTTGPACSNTQVCACVTYAYVPPCIQLSKTCSTSPVVDPLYIPGCSLEYKAGEIYPSSALTGTHVRFNLGGQDVSGKRGLRICTPCISDYQPTLGNTLASGLSGSFLYNLRIWRRPVSQRELRVNAMSLSYELAPAPRGPLLWLPFHENFIDIINNQLVTDSTSGGGSLTIAPVNVDSPTEFSLRELIKTFDDACLDCSISCVDDDACYDNFPWKLGKSTWENMRTISNDRSGRLPTLQEARSLSVTDVALSSVWIAVTNPVAPSEKDWMQLSTRNSIWKCGDSYFETLGAYPDWGDDESVIFTPRSKYFVYVPVENHKPDDSKIFKLDLTNFKWKPSRVSSNIVASPITNIDQVTRTLTIGSVRGFGVGDRVTVAIKHNPGTATCASQEGSSHKDGVYTVIEVDGPNNTIKVEEELVRDYAAPIFVSLEAGAAATSEHAVLNFPDGVPLQTAIPIGSQISISGVPRELSLAPNTALNLNAVPPSGSSPTALSLHFAEPLAHPIPEGAIITIDAVQGEGKVCHITPRSVTASATADSNAMEVGLKVSLATQAQEGDECKASYTSTCSILPTSVVSDAGAAVSSTSVSLSSVLTSVAANGDACQIEYRPYQEENGCTLARLNFVKSWNIPFSDIVKISNQVVTMETVTGYEVGNVVAIKPRVVNSVDNAVRSCVAATMGDNKDGKFTIVKVDGQSKSLTVGEEITDSSTCTRVEFVVVEVGKACPANYLPVTASSQCSEAGAVATISMSFSGIANLPDHLPGCMITETNQLQLNSAGTTAQSALGRQVCKPSNYIIPAGDESQACGEGYTEVNNLANCQDACTNLAITSGTCPVTTVTESIYKHGCVQKVSTNGVNYPSGSAQPDIIFNVGGTGNRGLRICSPCTSVNNGCSITRQRAAKMTSWTTISFDSYPKPREGHSAVVNLGIMYIFGGYDGSLYRNDVHFLDLEREDAEKAWTPAIPRPVQGAYLYIRTAAESEKLGLFDIEILDYYGVDIGLGKPFDSGALEINPGADFLQKDFSSRVHARSEGFKTGGLKTKTGANGWLRIDLGKKIPIHKIRLLSTIAETKGTRLYITDQKMATRGTPSSFSLEWAIKDGNADYTELRPSDQFSNGICRSTGGSVGAYYLANFANTVELCQAECTVNSNCKGVEHRAFDMMTGYCQDSSSASTKVCTMLTPTSHSNCETKCLMTPYCSGFSTDKFSSCKLSVTSSDPIDGCSLSSGGSLNPAAQGDGDSTNEKKCYFKQPTCKIYTSEVEHAISLTPHTVRCFRKTTMLYRHEYVVSGGGNQMDPRDRFNHVCENHRSDVSCTTVVASVAHTTREKAFAACLSLPKTRIEHATCNAVEYNAATSRAIFQSCPTTNTCNGVYSQNIYEYWKLIAMNEPSPRANHSTSLQNGIMYIFGGWNGNNIFGDTWAFDTGSFKWSELISFPSAPTARHSHAAIILSGRNVVFGGIVGNPVMDGGNAHCVSSRECTLTQNARSDDDVVYSRDQHAEIPLIREASAYWDFRQSLHDVTGKYGKVVLASGAERSDDGLRLAPGGMASSPYSEHVFPRTRTLAALVTLHSLSNTGGSVISAHQGLPAVYDYDGIFFNDDHKWKIGSHNFYRTENIAGVAEETEIGVKVLIVAVQEAANDILTTTVYRNGVKYGLSYTKGVPNWHEAHQWKFLFGPRYLNSATSGEGNIDVTIHKAYYWERALSLSEVSSLFIHSMYPQGTTDAAQSKTFQSQRAQFWTPKSRLNHFWDFRTANCAGGVVDSVSDSGLRAYPKGTAVCTKDGVQLDGTSGYVDIDDWTWGGTTSFEIYMKWTGTNPSTSYEWVLDFGNYIIGPVDTVRFYRQQGTDTLFAAVFRGTEERTYAVGTVSQNVWTHYVFTVEGNIWTLYKDGMISWSYAPESSGPATASTHEPRTSMRRGHYLGKAVSTLASSFLTGTIAYFGIWHGISLDHSEATSLFTSRNSFGREQGWATSIIPLQDSLVYAIGSSGNSGFDDVESEEAIPFEHLGGTLENVHGISQIWMTGNPPELSEFTASDNVYYDIAHKKDFNWGKGPFTVAFWFKSTKADGSVSTEGDHACVFYKDGPGSGSPNRQFRILAHNNGKITVMLDDNNYVESSTGPNRWKAWTHIRVTREHVYPSPYNHYVVVRNTATGNSPGGWLGTSASAQACADGCKNTNPTAWGFTWMILGDKNCKCEVAGSSLSDDSNGAVYAYRYSGTSRLTVYVDNIVDVSSLVPELLDMSATSVVRIGGDSIATSLNGNFVLQDLYIFRRLAADVECGGQTSRNAFVTMRFTGRRISGTWNNDFMVSEYEEYRYRACQSEDTPLTQGVCTVYMGRTLAWCKTACTENLECTGAGFTTSNGKCEIHFTKITHTIVRTDDITCFVKAGHETYWRGDFAGNMYRSNEGVMMFSSGPSPLTFRLVNYAKTMEFSNGDVWTFHTGEEFFSRKKWSVASGEDDLLRTNDFVAPGEPIPSSMQVWTTSARANVQLKLPLSSRPYISTIGILPLPLHSSSSCTDCSESNDVYQMQLYSTVDCEVNCHGCVSHDTCIICEDGFYMVHGNCFPLDVCPYGTQRYGFAGLLSDRVCLTCGNGFSYCTGLDGYLRPPNYEPHFNDFVKPTQLTMNGNIEFTVSPGLSLGRVKTFTNFNFSLEIYPLAATNDIESEIIRFTNTTQDCCGYGDRLLALFFLPGSLDLRIVVGSTANGNYNTIVTQTDSKLVVDEWQKVHISVLNRYIYMQVRDAEMNVQTPLSNKRPTSSGTVQVLASPHPSSFLKPTPFTELRGPFAIANNSFKGSLALVPDYELKFEIRLTSAISADCGVLRFSSTTALNQYGSSLPWVKMLAVNGNLVFDLSNADNSQSTISVPPETHGIFGHSGWVQVRLKVEGAGATLVFMEQVKSCSGSPCRAGGTCTTVDASFSCSYTHTAAYNAERIHQRFGTLHGVYDENACPGTLQNIVYRPLKVGISNQIIGFTYYDQYPHYSLQGSLDAGSCDDSDNSFKITTATMCADAAVTLISGTTDPAATSDGAYPVGCVYKYATNDQILMLNSGNSADFSDDGSACSDATTCLCVHYPSLTTGWWGGANGATLGYTSWYSDFHLQFQFRRHSNTYTADFLTVAVGLSAADVRLAMTFGGSGNNELCAKVVLSGGGVEQVCSGSGASDFYPIVNIWSSVNVYLQGNKLTLALSGGGSHEHVLSGAKNMFAKNARVHLDVGTGMYLRDISYAPLNYAAPAKLRKLLYTPL